MCLLVEALLWKVSYHSMNENAPTNRPQWSSNGWYIWALERNYTAASWLILFPMWFLAYMSCLDVYMIGRKDIKSETFWINHWHLHWLQNCVAVRSVSFISYDWFGFVCPWKPLIWPNIGVNTNGKLKVFCDIAVDFSGVIWMHASKKLIRHTNDLCVVSCQT